MRDGGGAVFEDAQLDLARVGALGFVDVEAGLARALGLQADEDIGGVVDAAGPGGP